MLNGQSKVGVKWTRGNRQPDQTFALRALAPSASMGLLPASTKTEPLIFRRSVLSPMPRSARSGSRLSRRDLLDDWLEDSLDDPLKMARARLRPVAVTVVVTVAAAVAAADLV